jgi:hypothetical protein
MSPLSRWVCRCRLLGAGGPNVGGWNSNWLMAVVAVSGRLSRTERLAGVLVRALDRKVKDVVGGC